MHSNNKQNFRPDIDGLRALAVISVILFHAFPEFLSGGFIGVDIFFVISGFLISGIIFRNLDENTFSFLDFYGRRIRRIFPALILVLTATYAFGWFYLLADEYSLLGKHLLGSTAFISNFIYWHEAGYFDAVASTKPLLHLWSLSIEEQFYLVWPFILWLGYRYRFNLGWITALIATTSFALNIYGIFLSHDLVATFYSPQTRFWELLIGAMLAFCYQPISSLADRLVGKFRLCDLFSFAGLLFIGLGLIIIKPNDGFPGWWALMPTIGAALLIGSTSAGFFNTWFLSNRWMVRLGTISYPLYLWHWTILSYITILSAGKPAIEWRVVAVASSFVLAAVTYWWLEKPIRFGKRKKFSTSILIILMIFLGIIGANTKLRDGLGFRSIARLTEDLAHYKKFLGMEEQEFFKNSCFAITDDYQKFIENHCDQIIYPNAKNVMIVGDSLSAYLSPAIRKLSTEDKFNFMQFSSAYCAPLVFNVPNVNISPRCNQINQFVNGEIVSNKPDVLIIFALYMSYDAVFQGDDGSAYKKYLLEKINYYLSHGVKKVLIMGQIPTWTETLPHTMAKKFALQHLAIPERTLIGVDPTSLMVDDKFMKLDLNKSIDYVSMKNFLCNEAGCLTKVGPNIKEDLIYIDGVHFSPAGASYVTQKLLAPYLP